MIAYFGLFIEFNFFQKAIFKNLKTYDDVKLISPSSYVLRFLIKCLRKNLNSINTHHLEATYWESVVFGTQNNILEEYIHE